MSGDHHFDTAAHCHMSGPLLSFCIPVMDRLPDLQQTLARNLDDNRHNPGRVEFIVACFDEDSATERWIHEHFAGDIKTGFLRFERATPLPFWHFGRAKNAFKNVLRGTIYASLDADNFTGPGAADHIIKVFEVLDYRCVFHQFQGTWGDGTSGRIAMPRADYERCGYDERLLPRQWDEMDAMLSVLAGRPDYAYACYRGKGVVRKSPHFRRFFEDHQRTLRVHEVDPASDPGLAHPGASSLGQRSKRYVKDDPLLVGFSNHNQYQSFFKNSDDERLRSAYVSRLVTIQQQLIRTVEPAQLQTWVLDAQTAEPAGPLAGGVTVLACLRDEADPERWYQHYRALGAQRFLLIDDGSAIPLSGVLPHDDVHVWKPRVGQFRYAKTFWLEILLARYCVNRWCLTVDADEFIALPEFEYEAETALTPLDTLVTLATDTQRDYFCGFLLDLHPHRVSGIARTHDDHRNHDHFQYNAQPPTGDYVKAPAVRWSYGKLSPWAFSLDLRYRLNQSLDSLRKFPCFRYDRGVHLNQGFHDLIINGKPRPATELRRADLLPIRHYKLLGLAQKHVTREARPANLPDMDFSAYHPRTRGNLERLGARLDRFIEQAAALPDSFPFLAYGLVPIPAAASITLHPAKPSASNQERLERQCGFYFAGVSDQVQVKGYALSGPDFETAVAWLRGNTPYQELEKEQAGSVTLRATPDPSLEAPRRTWFKLRGLTKKV